MPELKHKVICYSGVISVSGISGVSVIGVISVPGGLRYVGYARIETPILYSYHVCTLDLLLPHVVMLIIIM